MRKKNVLQPLNSQSEDAILQNRFENKLRFEKAGRTKRYGISKASNPVFSKLDSEKMSSEFIFFFSKSAKP